MKKLFAILFILTLLCTACSTGTWVEGEWTLSFAIDREGKKLTPQEFHKDIFDLGDSVSMSEMQAIAQRTMHVTKLTLKKDGGGTVEYVSPLGKFTEDCTWAESDGTLEINFKGRKQFELQIDKRSNCLAVELKESQRLSEKLAMTSVVYTLKYEKK